jgi:hypothetical protein
MNVNETLSIAALMLAPAFFSLLAMGALGSPIIATISELTAKAKGRVFFDKYGQQTASMGLILLLLLILVYGAATGVAVFKFPQFFLKRLPPPIPILYAFIAFGVFVILGVPYFLSWKKMRNLKSIHIALGLGASIAAIACVAIAVPAKLTIGLSCGTSKIQEGYAYTAMATPLATMYAVLMISAAAALSCAYLVIRRNKDDFGRDYYSFSLKLAARWAALPMLGFLACQGWLFAVLPENIKLIMFGTPLGIIWATAAALGAICIAIWLLIARSTSPLQLKGLTFLAVGLIWIMHTMNATLFINLMSL